MHQLVNKRFDSISQAKLSEFTYTYDPAGRRSRIESLEGVTDYSYDSLGELTSEIKSLNGANLYQAAYEYDPSGNRTRMFKDGTEHIYSYNSLNQLTQEGLTGPAAMPITVTGTVSDPNGIQALTVNGSNAVLNGNSFSAQISLSSGENTLTVIATDKANNSATKTLKVTYVQTDQILYVYDNNGNLIHKQSATQELILSYDYENRLTRVIASPAQQGEAIYAYDGEGKRVSSTANSTTTNYLYDGLDILLETNVSGDPVASYLRNPYSAGGIGGIISSQGLIPGQGTVPEVYYSYDGLGSVANLSDTSGINIQSYSYEAFGNTLSSFTSNNSRQFLTKELDSTGLIYFGARYYDPSIGRFITQDPMGMIDGPNVYLYCLNDPVNDFDPLGLWLALGTKRVGKTGANHTVIIMHPENGANFACANRFYKTANGEWEATLSANPNWKPNLSSPFGNLVATLNIEGERPSNLKNMRRILDASGRTEAELIRDILAAAKRYQDNLPYDPTPIPGTGYYNSNSYIYGILKEAGVSCLPNLPGWEPGADVPIPLN